MTSYLRGRMEFLAPTPEELKMNAVQKIYGSFLNIQYIELSYCQLHEAIYHLLLGDDTLRAVGIT